jgi:hypothetical protein
MIRRRDIGLSRRLDQRAMLTSQMRHECHHERIAMYIGGGAVVLILIIVIILLLLRR